MGTEISRKELRNPILCSKPAQPHHVSLTALQAAFEDAAEKRGNVPGTPQAKGTQPQLETSAWFPPQTQGKR